MKLSREEAWAGTLESMVDNRVVFYLRRYNRDYQDYSRQMKELCEKYPATGIVIILHYHAAD